MPDSRADSLHLSYFSSSEKFDYFILGAIGAILTYLVQNVEPSQALTPIYIVNLVALVLLLLAMLFGFIRISASIECKKLNALVLSMLERLGKLVKAQNNMLPGQLILNEETGQTMNPTELNSIINDISTVLPQHGEILKKRVSISTVAFHLRNILFLLGFVGVFFAKVFGPFIG